ncbi:hypothetical protein Vretimale_17344, partial [Volvox reticuliferus]
GKSAVSTAAAPAIPVSAVALATHLSAPPEAASGAGTAPIAVGTQAAPAAAATAPAEPSFAATISSAGAYAPLEIWEPQPDVSRVLAGCVAVLAPSLWLEAWGMVVTEALLRGLPAIVSNLGGLPEAGMGVCPTVPVEPIRIPSGRDGVPDWDARKYPKQDIDAWERALLSLLRLDSSVEAGADSGGRDGVHDDVGGCDHVSGNNRVYADHGGISADGKDGSGSSGRVVGGGGNCVAGNKMLDISSGAVVHQSEAGGSSAWERLSREGRSLALAHVQRADVLLSEWLTWLARLC